MAREKRVVLILVEGPSDENALLEPMQAALNFAANGAPPSEGARFHCDVTTVRPFSWEASFAVKDRVRDTVRQFVVDRIASRHEYEWTDLDRIIHIVDLDAPSYRTSASSRGTAMDSSMAATLSPPGTPLGW